MRAIKRLVSVSFKDEAGKQNKVQFMKIFDDVADKATYEIRGEGLILKVEKEEGNLYYKKLRAEHPESVSLLIFDDTDEINYHRVFDHYEVTRGGKFVCSCDNMQEVREEVARLKRAAKG